MFRRTSPLLPRTWRHLAALLLVMGALWAPVSRAEHEVDPDVGDFRCPATNVAFFEEIKKAGWLGYGETWDMNTCGEGYDVFAEGATSRWRKMRRQFHVFYRLNVDAEFYTFVLPAVTFGSLAVMLAIAWVVAFFVRRRKVVVVDVPCPACSVNIPVPLTDLSQGSLFCPACGGASVVVVDGPDGPAPKVHEL